jgi:hypothetical protein
MNIKRGDFIRVKSDHENPYRRDKDGMVTDVLENQVGLVFGSDRHNELQRCECVGTELWNIDELDLSTILT